MPLVSPTPASPGLGDNPGGCFGIAGPAHVAQSHAAAELGWPSRTTNSTWWVHSNGVAMVQEQGDPCTCPVVAEQG